MGGYKFKMVKIEEVAENLNEGWKLYGNPVPDTNILGVTPVFYQAMIYNPKKSNQNNEDDNSYRLDYC